MVRFAPLSIPLGRRAQTLVVLVSHTLQLLAIILSLVLIFNIFTLPLMLVYIAWIYYDKAPSRGGRKSNALRTSRIFEYYRDYFPISLVKTADLDPKKNYVFGYHPHGIIGVGAVGNFSTEATGFGEKFPGIDLKLLTLAMNFNTPFYREYLLALGICDVSRPSCDYILRSGPGKSIMIVVGGAAEALDAHPNSFVLTLANRKGFVKVALANGADLVPVIGFGETDVWSQVPNPPGSKLRAWQTKLQRVFGFSMPLIHGRGIFNYDWGLLPHRRPITTIVGAPIKLPHIPQPNDEEISKYHDLYVQKLKDLFNEHKETYSPGATIEIK